MLSHTTSDASLSQDATMMTAFQARYGTDRTVADQRVPQPLRQQAVIDYNLFDDDELQAKGSGARRAAGGALVSQLFLHHLECTGSKDIAETLRDELSQQRVDESCFVPSLSPIVFSTTSWTTGAFKSPAEKDMLSSLQLLLCPAANTREKVLLLLSDARKKIVDTCVGLSRNESHLDVLTAMAIAPMWSDKASLAASGQLLRNDKTGRVVAASLNQLVEQLTNVFITPHVSRSEELQAMDDSFARAFLMTHRYFTSSHVLLAKLLQRFFVPCSVPFSEHYDQRGVLINAPPSLAATLRSPYNGQVLGKRTALHLQVTKLIQIKVCCIIAQWLNLHPDHFDKTMLDAIEAFLAENCYVPAVWADCPAQLMQAAEFIKEGVVRARNPALHSAVQQQSLPPTLRAQAAQHDTPAKAAIPTTPPAKHNSEAVLSHLFGGDDPFAGPVENAANNNNSGEAGGGGTRHNGIHISLEQLSYLNNFFAEDDTDVAVRLSTIDHETLRRISPSELFLVAVNNGIAQLHGASHPSLCLINHLRGLEEVTSWAATLVLIAGYHDATQKQTSTNAAARFVKMEQVVEKLLSIAYRLLELNNMHSAFGIVAGLRHPAVARLHQPIIAGRFQKVAVFESLCALMKIFKFENGIAEFEEYIAAIPDPDVFPFIPLVHISIDEIRSLVSSQPTIVRAAAAATDALSSDAALIHWRKFFVLSAIFDNFEKSQRAPVQGALMPDPSAVRWKARSMSHAITNPKALVQLSAAIWPL